MQLQISILATVPGPVIVCDDDNGNDKPDHLTTLIVFGGYIMYVFEAIVECLLVLMMEDDDNNDNNDDEEEMEEIEEL